MSFKANHTDTANYGSLIVEDKTVNNDTSLSLLGHKYAGYSKIMAENLLHLLENFASKDAPENPIVGQLWYNSNSNAIIPNPSLMIWNGTNWVPANNITKSTTAPASSLIGNLWIDTAGNQLKVWNGTKWILIGPESRTDADGRYTGLYYSAIGDLSGGSHWVIGVIVLDTVIAIISSDTFTRNGGFDEFNIDDFSDTINAGINLATHLKLYGTATIADSLNVIGSSDPVSANEFLRRTQPTPTFTNALTIDHNDGLNIKGTSLKIDSDILTLSNPNGGLSLSSKTGSSSTTISLNDIAAVINKSLTVTDNITSSSLTVNGTITAVSSIIPTSTINDLTISSSIIPSSTGSGFIGTDDNKFATINAKTINAETLNLSNAFAGGLSENIQVKPSSGTTNYKLITSGTSLKLVGDVTALGVPTQGANEVIFTTQLGVGAISDKPQITNFDSNGRLLILSDNILKSISLPQISIPVGGIILYAGNTAPVGFLKCDGTKYSTTAYAALFAVIGTTYGADTNKFGVPDLTALSGISYYIFTGKY
jgi:hypothetical protein